MGLCTIIAIDELIYIDHKHEAVVTEEEQNMGICSDNTVHMQHCQVHGNIAIINVKELNQRHLLNNMQTIHDCNLFP